jgi:hypothetical protein
MSSANLRRCFVEAVCCLAAPAGLLILVLACGFRFFMVKWISVSAKENFTYSTTLPPAYSNLCCSCLSQRD